MTSFLKGHTLWQYITGEKVAPIQKHTEDIDAFEKRLDEWDSNNHKIISWITNTFVTSIGLLLGKYATAQKVWDFLARRYIPTDLS